MGYPTELSLALLAVILYLIVKYPNRGLFVKNRPDLKGLPGWPVIGNMSFRRSGEHSARQLEFGLAHFKLYGPARTYTLPGRRILEVSRPEWLEHIQKTNFDNYVKGAVMADVMEDMMGRGIFVTDGDSWYYQRKTTTHILTDIFRKNAEKKAVVNLSEVFYRFTLDAFALLAFGKETKSLSDEAEGLEGRKFADAFDFCQLRLDYRFNDILLWKLKEKYLNIGKQTREAIKVVDDYAYHIIDEKLEKKRSEEKENGAQDLLDLFMAVKLENGSHLSRKELRDAVLNLMIAGRDTTAVAMSWAFYHLIKDPHYITWLREEVDQTDTNVDYDKFKSLSRVHAVFYETLRLHPSVPKNIKVALKDDQLPHGPKVDAGTIVRWGDWEMGRNPEIWGPDALKFKPERWLTTEGDLIRPDPWKFHVFNAGPRLCPGQQFATFEAVSTIAQLVKQFDWKFAPGYYESVPKADGKLQGIPDNTLTGEDTPLYGESLILNMLVPLSVSVCARNE